MSKTITIKFPEITDVEFELECIPEDMQIRGNAIASGDDEEDKEVEDNIIEQLENGNEWAWCIAKVTAKYKTFEGTSYLGGCSYESAADFKKDGYYTDMVQTAYEDLLTEMKGNGDAITNDVPQQDEHTQSKFNGFY